MNIAPRSLIFLYTPSPSPAPSPSSLFSAPPSSINPNLKPGYPSGNASSYPSVSNFNGPYMGVVLVVLLVAFFLMASFSVYVRRYAFVFSNEAGLGADGSARRGRGLDRAAIDGLPIVVYHCMKGELKDDTPAPHAHEWSCRPDCVVCLTDFQEAEKVRLLPRCEHCFHPECIDMWLFSHTTCPVCRRSLLPPPPPPPSSSNTDVYINVLVHPPPPVSPSETNTQSVYPLIPS